MWFIVFGIVLVLAIIVVCTWYGFSVKKQNKMSKVEYFMQNAKLFHSFLCADSGTSLDEKPIYDDNFPYEKLGL